MIRESRKDVFYTCCRSISEVRFHALNPRIVRRLLLLACSQLWALEIPKVPDIGDMTKGSLLGKVNKSLADQQNKDGQFEFKTGKRSSLQATPRE